jgi:hypothetical protein
MAEMDPGFRRDDDEDRLLPIPKTTRKGILGVACLPFRKMRNPGRGAAGVSSPVEEDGSVFASSRGEGDDANPTVLLSRIKRNRYLAN